MRARLMMVLTFGIGACAEPDDGLRHTDLAGLGEVTLSMWIGSHVAELDIGYRGTCAKLGDDFHAALGDVGVGVWPGSMEDVCASPTTSQPCIPEPPACADPSVNIDGLPYGPDAVVTFGDTSRTIECDLGNDFVARTMTLVSAPANANGSWDVVAGAPITLQWSPGGDIPRFGRVEIEIDAVVGSAAIPYTVEGDLVTFTVPATLAPRQHILSIAESDDLAPSTKDCHGVKNTQTHSYVVEQFIEVH